MAYKFDEARKAGVSDTEIVEHLKAKGEYTYKFDEARKAGVSDTEIVEHLKAKSAMPVLGEKVTPKEVTAPIIASEPPGVIVQPEDVTATIPTSLTYGSTVEQPEYKSEAEFESIRSKQLSEAQKTATVSTFPQTVIDPKTGEKTVVQPEGLETDIPVMFGKLATVRFLTPEMEAKLGGNAAAILSKEAQLILSRNPESMPLEEAAKLLQGIPKEDQALALANRLGHETLGNIKKALENSKDEILLANELKRRKQVLLDTIGQVDVQAAKAKYADMIDTVAKDYHSVHDASPILNDLDFLEKFYGTTPSKANSVVGQMKTVLAEDSKINLSDALEFRADINYLLSAAKRGKERVKLDSIKKNIDGFIDSVATPEQKVLIDEAISTYSRTMTNNDLLKVISKSTKKDRAIDWVKLDKALIESNLKSPEVEVSMNIVKEFSERFKNDVDLVGASVVKGIDPDSGGVFGVWGYMANQLKDILALWGNRADNLRIQGAILRSLRNSKTNLDFVEKLKTQKVPEEVIKVFEDLPTKEK